MKKLAASVALAVVALSLVPVAAFAQTATTSAPRPVCTLSANPITVTLGNTSLLTWSSQYATDVTITSIGSVGTQGQQGVIPTGGGTTYVATFIGPGGSTQCSVTVTTDTNKANVGAAGGGTDFSSQYNNTSTYTNTGVFNAVPQQGTPSVAPAQSAIPTQPAGNGLVPCGNTTGLVPGTPAYNAAATSCQLCNVAQLAQNLINFLIGLSIPIAAALFAYAGWLYFTSAVMDEIEKAKKILMAGAIGFFIAISAWLVVQTFLKTILSSTYQTWNTIQCVDQNTRQRSTSVNQLLQSIPAINSAVQPTGSVSSVGGSAYVCSAGTLVGGNCVDSQNNVIGTPQLRTSPDNSGLSCPAGLSLAGGGCYDEMGNYSGEAVPAAPTQVGVGDCSPNALTPDFGTDAAAMSCIATRESGCSTISQGDRLGGSNYFASIGTYQINMSNHQVQCDEYNGGQAVNCPAAFSEPYTGSSKNRVQIVNQGLYDQCKTMLMNPGCNSQVAQGVLDVEGTKAWSTSKQCGV